MDFILKRRGVAEAQSDGLVMGHEHHGLVHRAAQRQGGKLVLYAPRMAAQRAVLDRHRRGKLGAYRSVSCDAAKARWLTGVPERQESSILFRRDGSRRGPKRPSRRIRWVRRLNPPMLARQMVWSRTGANSGAPASRCTTRPRSACQRSLHMPNGMRTFRATCSMPTSRSSSNAPYKRYVQIGEGTHTVIMEKNRMQLFQAVQQFLDENLKPDM